MQELSNEQFQRWREDAKVLEQDRYGEKVLILADGTFLKLFRRKSWFSKTLFFPPAKRFAENAEQLTQLGIPCPRVINLYKMQAPYRSVVHYEPLAGDTLRKLLNEESSIEQIELFAQLATFITELHDLGVYFRSLHLGNIVLTPDGALGLIDISDMRCLNRPLSTGMRNRNYRHLLRYESDWALVNPRVKTFFPGA
ncbi:Lipopolysaccharide kinase (Kdo/WaaP) family protein [Halopseudomonas sabulinigri]|uniref:Lipopolysaccharide kinase (Kdo/WaaP) family protein n=1 Tax=Halopseudomonas sabulinigri TaxID=472181 RepID=A0A1H1QSD7_9GAMM|nr:lipopolysaccharide kinase InaA family protein [Halopseudomonas sabulinigri]SDS26306.1 Lipopolysaccharide kinase (Kdo/WaaP) family protein [Halopseudomonas sabulinigri]